MLCNPSPDLRAEIFRQPTHSHNGFPPPHSGTLYPKITTTPLKSNIDAVATSMNPQPGPCLAGREIDWYCTVCDMEMEIDARTKHMSTPFHVTNLSNIGIRMWEEGDYGGESGLANLMSWTCIICDVTVNIFHRDGHLHQKSHARKACTYTPEEVLSEPEPPRATWECTVCEESMHVFYQAEHVAGKKHFRRLCEKRLEDPAAGCVPEIHTSIGGQDEGNNADKGALLDGSDLEASFGSEAGVGDDQQGTDNGVSLEISPAQSQSVSAESTSANNFYRGVSDRQDELPEPHEQLSSHDAPHLPTPTTEQTNASLHPGTHISTPSQPNIATRRLYCDICQKGFKKPKMMDTHLLSKKHLTAAVAESFYCEVCEKDLKMKDRKRHRGPAWKCMACDVSMHTMWRVGHLSRAEHQKNQLLLEKRMAAVVSG